RRPPHRRWLRRLHRNRPSRPHRWPGCRQHYLAVRRTFRPERDGVTPSPLRTEALSNVPRRSHPIRFGRPQAPPRAPRLSLIESQTTKISLEAVVRQRIPSLLTGPSLPAQHLLPCLKIGSAVAAITRLCVFEGRKS